MTGSCFEGLGEILEKYHDEEWGVPVHDDRLHYEYLVMESMSCGLSWELMLKKREIFRQVFAGFDPARVATFTGDDVDRAMSTEGMIRSHRKIEAMVSNARCFLQVQHEWGSFDRYIWSFTGGKTWIYRSHQQPGIRVTRNDLSDRVAADMRKRGFRYLGSVILYSHLQGIGIINDHAPTCPRYARLIRQADIEYR